ncbi:hypothetical protein WER97_06070 [Staphylococcus felis]|uniref:Cthe-2314-like HEPN domain-containing protein n=1 Tax=Staphylococcus felis TaxID=46127 RepID=A0ABS0QRA7_9STAP|nr:hypothetical protein [Staphylococcus felis]MBH9581240.1 hypothetical protein [Staphylococcus felis]REI06188.1 hypothetical protein DOS69_08750 [Staphylococcus felis]
MDNSIFNYKNNEHFSLLNWQYHHSNNNHLDTMAQAYNKTVEVSMNYLIKNINSNIIRDQMIFPVIFNFNHYIELKLKSCLIYISLICDKNDNDINKIIKNVMNKKIKKTDKYPNTHDISKILTILLHSIKKTNVFEDKYSSDNKLKHTKEYIDDLYSQEFIKGSSQLDLFRFPLNIDQENYKYVEKFSDIKNQENIGVSIVKLRQKIIDVSNELEALSNFLDSKND